MMPSLPPKQHSQCSEGMTTYTYSSMMHNEMTKEAIN